MGIFFFFFSSLEAFLIDRVVNSAARRVAITGSTVLRRIMGRFRVRTEASLAGDASEVDSTWMLEVGQRAALKRFGRYEPFLRSSLEVIGVLAFSM